MGLSLSSPQRAIQRNAARAAVLAFAAFAAALVPHFFACAAPPHRAAPAARNAPLKVEMDHRFSAAPLALDRLVLPISSGEQISVSRLAYFVSDVALLRADGSRVAVQSGPAYLNAVEQRLLVLQSAIPEGNYTGITFRVGLDPALNHSNPAKRAPGDALNPMVNGLHWGWQGGYVFCAIEGRARAADGTAFGYSYHLATDALTMPVRLDRPIRINAGTKLTLAFDLARVFQGITIRDGDGSDSTHSRPGDALARRLAGNVTRAFRVESLTAAAPLPAAAATPRPGVTAKAYPFVVPEGFPQPTLPPDNPLTVAGVALGKRLFFDTRLSGNDTQSCASCHQPAHGFSESGRVMSIGIDGLPGTRRSMPLFNLAWSAGAYTWDGRRTRLRDQALAPITDVREMHGSLADAVRKLSADRAYPAQFAAAFGTPGITSDRVGRAIEQYLLTIVSADSRFDRALKGEVKLTDDEKRGLLIFLTEYDPARGVTGGDCFHCHGGSLFTDYRFHNNGLDTDALFKDLGRYAVTKNDDDRAAFKTPSLRNVALRAPYMHDGRFKTLEEVVDHYSDHIRFSDSLDPNIAKHPDGGVNLSADDKRALLAFLRALTDPQFTKE